MEITLYGAAGEVTGSCYLVETGSARVVVDCGLFQGPERLERLNRIPRGLISKPLDAVLLTHAHLDHCGRLPLLVKSGYSGPIYATEGTIDFSKLILNDAAKIQQQDTDRENRRRDRLKLPLLEPLFTSEDVRKACNQMQCLDYNQWHQIAGGIKAQLADAGHILGSASVQLVVDQNGGRRNIVFSGDLGGWGTPIVRDPSRIDYADVVFVESTYGDRDHRPLAETVSEFERLIKHAVDNKGKILIPTFAVGRAQQIMYHLARMFREREIRPFPIYLDSPMAISATQLYARHQSLMDEEAVTLHRSGQLKMDLATVTPCQTPDESKALNSLEGPCLILAGAGMCNAGRILHHLRHNLALSSTIVVIVGYQVKGSLGRLLVEGAPKVKIFGETIPVHATVHTLGGFSAHAGQSDLLRWLEPMARHRPRVIITHGEEHPRQQLAARVQELYNLSADIPKMGETLSL